MKEDALKGLEAFKECRYNFDPLDNSVYGCTNPEVIALGTYPVVKVGKEIQTNFGLADEYANLFERNVFYKYPTSIGKITELVLKEFEKHSDKKLTDIFLELENDKVSAKTSELDVLVRALAGCAHCKHYESRK